MMLGIKSLSEVGLKVGDVVTVTNGRDEFGGTLYRIVQNTEPVKPHTTTRKEKRKEFDYKSNRYEEREVDVYGAWDEKGKKIMVAALEGFIRIRPVMSFFPGSSAKYPKGKDKTVIIHYKDLRSLRVVDIVELCNKHLELTNLINEIVKSRAED